MKLVIVGLNDILSEKMRVLEIIMGHAQVEIPYRREFLSIERHSKVTDDLLTERFGIGMYQSKVTLKFRDKIGMRSEVLHLPRRSKPNQK